MKNICPCGGIWLRNGKAQCKTISESGIRYKCKECGKSITVRVGKIVTNSGPRIADWRGS